MPQTTDVKRETQRSEGERRFRLEDRFRLFVDAVTDYAVIMLDPEGIISTWNLGAERMYGYELEEIVGEPLRTFWPGDAVGEPENELLLSDRSGRFEGEGWRVRKDGSRFCAKVVMTALRATDGRLLGFGMVTHDLTEKRLAEDAVRDANTRQMQVATELSAANSYLKNLINASTLTSIIATDLNGVVVLFNRGAELMLGYSAAEVVGIHTPALFHKPDEVKDRGRALSALLKRPIHGFEVFTASIGRTGFEHAEWTYIRKDTRLLSVTLTLSCVLDEHRQPIGYLGVAEDITHKRMAEKKIAAAYTQLNAVLECTSDSVMTIGRDWTLLYGNRHAIESLPDFEVGRKYWECFPAVIGTPSEQILRTAMETRTEASYERFYAPYETWFKVRIYPSEVGLSAFFINITEEKKLQEQLAVEQILREKRIEALSHMAGGLAHEISNPLAIIHARASDLKSAAEDGETLARAEVLKASESIVQTSDRAMRILRGLRGFAREAGSDPMEWASIDNIVDQCVDLQDARFERHQIDLGVNVARGVPLLLCREIQIGQILTNLLNNAFDAVDQSHASERWVTLKVAQVGETIQAEVTDSGPGIEDQFRPYLMDPFFTTKTQGLGMGVGLSLSRAIAQDHGGSLKLVDGIQHTTFRLLLPIEPSA